MANEGFNSSTFTFNGARSPLESIAYSDSAAEIAVTGSTDATHVYVAGKSNPAITVELVGASTETVGSTGTAVVTWFDGNTHTLTNSVVISVDESGSLDDKLTTSIGIRPTRA